VIADLTVVWLAVENPTHKDWFGASLQLLGSLVPLLLVILLLAFANRGPEAIRRKTSYLLLNLVPDTVVSSLTWSWQFDPAEKSQWSRVQAQLSNVREASARVEVAYRRGDFCCVYRITFPQAHTKPATMRVVFLAVELKVRQANMHLCVPREAFEKYCNKSAMKGYDAFRKAFNSTLTGAEKAECSVNTTVYHFLYSQDMPQTAVVVHRNLSPDFFTDPSEQLFWAQDMVIMLKGFVEEGLDESQPVQWFPQSR
jgi:hypothetical protein